MNSAEEAAFLAEASRFLTSISYGGPRGSSGVPSSTTANSYAAGASEPPDALAKASRHLDRVLSGDAWLAEGASALPRYRKRAKFASADSKLPGYSLSILSYLPPAVRRTLKQSHGQTIAPALLAKPMAGKVLSYRYLLPVGSNSEETAADPSERPGDGEEFDKTDAAYDPEFLDNPELRSGKHRTIINLTSYVASINHFTKADFLKREINEKFRKLHPDLPAELTLSQIRNLKLRLLEVTVDVGLELATVARAYVYLEKLILARAVSKPNRRVVGGCCLLLAAKATDSKSTSYGRLLDALSTSLSVARDRMLELEFVVLARLHFRLQLGEEQWGVHLARILNTLDYSNLQEYLGERMHQLWQAGTAPHE